MMYNLVVPNHESLTTLTFTIKGPLSALEAQDVMFGQVEAKKSITCITFDKNGKPIRKTANPYVLIQNDDQGQFGNLHANIQEAKEIIIG